MNITKAFRQAWPLISKLPDGTYISQCYIIEGEKWALSLLIHEQEKFVEVRKVFGAVIWRKKWDNGQKWWEYNTILPDGSTVNVFAMNKPSNCKAIIEKKMVKRQVAVKYKEVEVEQEVIVGWDCGDSGKELDR